MRSLFALFALLALPVAANPVVEVSTTQGNFTLELYSEKAPATVANFLRYVEDGSYVGTQFHRVIPNFVAQGGGFDKSFKRSPVYDNVKNESSNGLSNAKGTIAMARTSEPDSATRQFYINLKNNSFLDASGNKAGYTVFGKVTQGFVTFEKMVTVPTVTIPEARMQNVPQQPILIEKVEVTKP